MLTPEVIIQFQLWSKIIDDQRRNRTGVFALENSEEFKKYLHLEHEKLFGVDKKSEN